MDYTDDQKSALLLIQTFLHSKELFFLLAGNAGTGKTTLAENIANYSNARLIAPTNAAIQRLKDKIGGNQVDNRKKFATIHSVLYGHPDPGTGEFIKREGLVPGAVYIVDEASMIDQKVLNDLLDEAKAGRSKLIFLGDDFQLPPVGKDPKLFNWERTRNDFKKDWRFKMNEVTRNEGSVLKVATHLRNNKGVQILNVDDQDFSIVPRFTNELVMDIQNDANCVVLVPTNKLRTEFNRVLRNIKYEEDAQNIFNDREKLISVANQVFANGESYEIRHPELVEEFEGKINVATRDNPVYKIVKGYLINHEVEGKIGWFKTFLIPNLDMPSLHSHQLLTNSDIRSSNKLCKNNKFNNRKREWRGAINIATYGYAISVHKSQGNEWDNVYVDASWLSPAWDKARWLYTALTRAKKKVELCRSNQFQIVDG
jgi:GTPase SAR1 family protein